MFWIVLIIEDYKTNVWKTILPIIIKYMDTINDIKPQPHELRVSVNTFEKADSLAKELRQFGSVELRKGY